MSMSRRAHEVVRVYIQTSPPTHTHTHVRSLLDPPYEALQRQTTSREHFMPASLLPSQLAAFELQDDITLCITSSPPLQPLISDGAISKGCRLIESATRTGNNCTEQSQNAGPRAVAGSLRLECESGTISCVVFEAFPSTQHVAEAIKCCLDDKKNHNLYV